jgi:hypothetical protein
MLCRLVLLSMLDLLLHRMQLQFQYLDMVEVPEVPEVEEEA